MTNKILLVTSPDDCLLDGIRVLYVDLSEEQNLAVSSALLSSNLKINCINYIWKLGEPVEWLLDKKIKSDLILFNAQSHNQSIVGYMAAQPNSNYFGILKDLDTVNNCAIYRVEDISTLLEKAAKQ